MENFKFDTFNEWSHKSDNVLFKSTIRGIGDGEQKLATEYNIMPRGQNSAFDMEIDGEKWEIKKLDKDGSFRLGVDVSSKYIDYLILIINCFNKLKSIDNDLLDSNVKTEIGKIIKQIIETKARCKYTIYEGIKHHEISQSNLDKLDRVIFQLDKIIFAKTYENSYIKLHCSIDGSEKYYTFGEALQKMLIDKVDNSEISKLLGGNDVFNVVYLQNTLKDELNLFTGLVPSKKLTDIIRSYFTDKILIIVDEIKGYKPLKTDMDKLICYRITSGGPRCKYPDGL